MPRQIREERIVHPEGHVEYRYFGASGQVKDVDLYPWGNRIPTRYQFQCWLADQRVAGLS